MSNNKLIDVEGLKVFKNRQDTENATKYAAIKSAFGCMTMAEFDAKIADGTMPDGAVVDITDDVKGRWVYENGEKVCISGSSVEEITYEEFKAHEAEYRASGKEYIVTGAPGNDKDVIADDKVATDTTWSSNKINSELGTKAVAETVNAKFEEIDGLTEKYEKMLPIESVSILYNKNTQVQQEAIDNNGLYQTTIFKDDSPKSVMLQFGVNEVGGVSWSDVSNPKRTEIYRIFKNIPESVMSHNTPRLVPKDLTEYFNNGTLYDRLWGRNGFDLCEDIYAGDYFNMGRAVTAPNQDPQYQTTGSSWVTIVSINGLAGNGDNSTPPSMHMVCVPGQGENGSFHFGRHRMNPTNTAEGGYAATELFTQIYGPVATSGSIASGATINQQLKYIFGDHLVTTRELLTNSINPSGYNRFGANSGCSNNWGWGSAQAIDMSEIEVFGSIVWSSSGYDTGVAKKQFEAFAHNTKIINNRLTYYWLKDIASAARFAYCDNLGYAASGGASDAHMYVRPRFVIS